MNPSQRPPRAPSRSRVQVGSVGFGTMPSVCSASAATRWAALAALCQCRPRDNAALYVSRRRTMSNARVGDSIRALHYDKADDGIDAMLTNAASSKQNKWVWFAVGLLFSVGLVLG